MGIMSHEPRVPQPRSAVGDEEAIRLGLLAAARPPFALPGWSRTLLSFGLALPTLGYMRVFVPLIRVAQHDHTGHHIAELRERIKRKGRPARDPPWAIRLAGPPGQRWDWGQQTDPAARFRHDRIRLHHGPLLRNPLAGRKHRRRR